MDSTGNVNTSIESLDSKADSDDEILVSRKSRGRRVLQESASEGDDESDSDRKTHHAEVKLQSDKENIFVQKNQTPSWILSIQENSDESDGNENVKAIITNRLIDEDKLDLQGDTPEERKMVKRQFNNVEEKVEKIKSKSKWYKEKERKMKTKLLKRKEKNHKLKVQDSEEEPPFNDNGCLFTDNDLFENLDEEESLDAIRAAVKDKLKKHKNRDVSEHVGYEHTFGHEEEESLATGKKRNERKAARASREALRHLHSESQRLIRESSLSLPYHLPEPRTIHEFYKHRPRPACQGSAMALLKSTKYQLCATKEGTEKVNASCSDNRPERTDKSIAEEEELKIHPPLLVLEGPDTRNYELLINTGTEDHKEENDCNETHTSEQCVFAEVHEKPISGTCSLECNGKMDTMVSQHQEALKPEEPALENQEDSNPEHQDPGVELGGLIPQVTSTVVPQESKKSKLEKLLALGVDLSIKPRLCPDDSSFVNLDEPKANKELEALKERFLKHTLHRAKLQNERKINLSIVRKETTAEGKQELKAEVVCATLAAETTEENVNTKPGEKLQVLKAKLQEAMKLRRIEERQKKQALLQLDNEDGFEEEEEEEEEEMTDESEEEEEGNQETVEFLLGEAEDVHAEEDLEDTGKETKKESVSGNTAAESAPSHSVPRLHASESTLLLFKDSSSKMGDSLTSEKIEFDETSGKQDGKSEEDESSLLLPLTKENSHNSSFELIGSMIPCYQPCNKQGGRGGCAFPTSGGFHSPTPGVFKSSFISSASKSSGKLSEPSLPVEDSQDLYNPSPDPKNPFLETEESQFRFSLEDDTQSQLLDADGFLNVGHHRNKYQVSSKHCLILDNMDENAMDANMAELLDCCSGQFNASHATDSPVKKKDMEELLKLCSGNFTSQADSSTQVSVSPKQQNDDDLMAEAVALCSGSFPTDREEEEELGEFQLLPDELSDSEDEEGSEAEEDGDDTDEEKEALGSEDEEEALLKQRQGRKRKLKLQDFLEDEAELSGSDEGSGDEYEGDEDDEYEEDDIEEDLPSAEVLQDQVNKIHRFCSCHCSKEEKIY
uniref:Claspin isoform X1 n=1 Tax=Geotrypetes seraphini TaxID=260995 RepID=A0A6P8S1R8_GEOSA|nr:claspin isoform X1 [Geotrypetes seraphini]